MSTLVDVLAAHVPYVGDHGVAACSCGQRGFNRDEGRNLLKDGEDERAWAEHVAEALARADAPAREPADGVHKPFPDDGVTYCGWAGDGGIVEGCGEVWPCTTVRARTQNIDNGGTHG